MILTPLTLTLFFVFYACLPYSTLQFHLSTMTAWSYLHNHVCHCFNATGKCPSSRSSLSSDKFASWENTAARLCTRANYEYIIEVRSCGDSSRQLLTSATKCTDDVQLFRTKQNKARSAVNRHRFSSTVIPLRFKNWFVHMSKLHKPGSNTFVTNMLLLVQYPGRGKHFSMVESDSQKWSIVKHI